MSKNEANLICTSNNLLKFISIKPKIATINDPPNPQQLLALPSISDINIQY